MTKLSKKIERETTATVFSAGRHRAVIVSIEPSGLLGFRLKGTRLSYSLSADGCYIAAVQAELAQSKKKRLVNRRARL